MNNYGTLLIVDDNTAILTALRCISLSDNNFIDALRSKLHWGEDGRQNHKL